MVRQLSLSPSFFLCVAFEAYCSSGGVGGGEWEGPDKKLWASSYVAFSITVLGILIDSSQLRLNFANFFTKFKEALVLDCIKLFSSAWA
jgi:hypothetical protein